MEDGEPWAWPPWTWKNHWTFPVSYPYLSGSEEARLSNVGISLWVGLFPSNVQETRSLIAPRTGACVYITVYQYAHKIRPLKCSCMDMKTVPHPNLCSTFLEFISYQYSVKLSQFSLSDVISKRTTFSQPFPPPSDPPANAPWFFLRYWHYIHHLLTYLALLRIWKLSKFRRLESKELSGNFWATWN